MIEQSIKLTVNDLFYINDAAKALKQKNFMYKNNLLIGLDNINDILIYTKIPDTPINYSDISIIFNTRALSAFIKTLSVETEFNININDIEVVGHNGSMPISFDKQLIYMATNKYIYGSKIEECNNFLYSENCINDNIQNLFTMHKSDGAMYLNYNNLLLTIFPGMIPLNKSDKVFVTIFGKNNTSFIAKFRVKKKKFEIITYVSYLYI